MNEMESYRDEYGRNNRDYRDYRDDYREDYREDYRDYRGSYRDDYRDNRDYRDRYGKNRREYRNRRNYREDYATMLEDVVQDGMELARAYEDVSEMATDGSEKQKLMKIAEREKEHYRTTKEMLQKHM